VKGRPKLPKGRARTKVLAIKLREEELQRAKERATAAGLSLSAYIRGLLK